jgi:AcrR family transcriptional regulator
MTPGVRERMVSAAAALLAQKGLQATSFSEVLERADAPRGSIYHHFPGGKDELVVAAVELVAERAMASLEAGNGGVVAITERFLEMWRLLLIRSDYRSGCAVVAVTVAAESPEVLGKAGAVFGSWRQRLQAMLRRSGLGWEDSQAFAATLIAASEGAVVLSRAERSREPFELVAKALVDQARMLQGGATPPPRSGQESKAPGHD